MINFSEESRRAIGNLELLNISRKGSIGIKKSLVDSLPEFGFSSIANILASIKIAKYSLASSTNP